MTMDVFTNTATFQLAHKKKFEQRGVLDFFNGSHCYPKITETALKDPSSSSLQPQQFGDNNSIQAWIAGVRLISASRAGSTHRYSRAANNTMNYGKSRIFPLWAGRWECRQQLGPVQGPGCGEKQWDHQSPPELCFLCIPAASFLFLHRAGYTLLHSPPTQGNSSA